VSVLKGWVEYRVYMTLWRAGTLTPGLNLDQLQQIRQLLPYIGSYKLRIDDVKNINSLTHRGDTWFPIHLQ